ncbi:MAG TPA: alkaline phosphatase family protein [Acidimicrobiales bacterium]|nr:alkaline phosphatase family protein [Acidimicrobiales bacterium]
MNEGKITRRELLAGGAGALAAGVLGGRLWRQLGTGASGTRVARSPRAAADLGALRASPASDGTTEALAVLGRSVLREPGSLPFPTLSAGTDTMPQVEHIVVLMMENHSYDNFLGMLGRGRGQRPRGDGFKIGANGLPTASNPYGDGRVQHAFPMPTTCQLSSKPSQEWAASHIQYAGGANDGFVISPSGPVAMGYWTARDLPFTYSLAETFPVGDRWFCSVLGQTDPNRRYLIAATSSGMTDDISTSPSIGNAAQDALLATPANGTIFDRLSEYGISWADYAYSFPTGATAELYPFDDALNFAQKKTFDDFFSDAASGNLPGFCLLDPDYSTQSQENPQNIVVGEACLSKVVQAVGSSPAWEKTLLVVVYDEHGGYYDHVPPPVALAPDLVPPVVAPGESAYDGFAHYGFRVPSIVVSPYARRNYVTSVVHDHTSILAMVERKWNLPALTYRDANANDLTDFLDMKAMAARHPTFPELPALAASGMSSSTLACSVRGPGTIPPAWSVSG